MVTNPVYFVQRERGISLTAKAGDRFFGMCFPGPYRLGIASLGFHAIVDTVYRLPRWRHERFFLDTGDSSLESQSSLIFFHVAGFSLAFERDIFSMLEMCSRADIPLNPFHRNSSHPLVIVGGPFATLNPEVTASFADIIVIGEAECVLPLLLEKLEDYPEKARNRMEILEKVADLPSMMVPFFTKPIYEGEKLTGFSHVKRRNGEKVKRAVDKLTGPPTISLFVTSESHFGNTALCEINRGCSRQCRFCAASIVYRPLRHRNVCLVKEKISTLSRISSKIGFVGSDILSHPHFESILEHARKEGMSVSCSSLSSQTLWERPELVERLAEAGVKTVTLAPESGSLSTRRMLGKNLTNREWVELLEFILNKNKMKVKLYFMLGKPWNNQEEDISFIKSAAGVSREVGRISVSYSFFVPKPQTPFERITACSFADWKKERAVFEKSVHGLGIGCSGESPRLAWIELLLARGDRLLGEKLPELLPHGRYGQAAWRALLESMGRDWEEWPRNPWKGGAQPWDVVDSGVDPGYLQEEMERARQKFPAPLCPGHKCFTCGVCKP